MARSVRARLGSVALGLALTQAALSCCSVVDGLTGPDPVAASSPAKAAPSLYDSQFTRDGTFQSHIRRDGLDFVYTLYPTKSTPRTNEWYPRGDKFFSFTFQAYDLHRRIRAPFATKRRVYLDHVTVTSSTITSDGARTQHPYRLDAVAKDVTFDPQPLSTRYGMLVTSPKGAFELRNQRIRGTSLHTRGLMLVFTATVWVQDAPGSTRFTRREVRQRVPIAIFPSTKHTSVAKIPVDAN